MKDAFRAGPANPLDCEEAKAGLTIRHNQSLQQSRNQSLKNYRTGFVLGALVLSVAAALIAAIAFATLAAPKSVAEQEPATLTSEALSEDAANATPLAQEKDDDKDDSSKGKSKKKKRKGYKKKYGHRSYITSMRILDIVVDESMRA